MRLAPGRAIARATRSLEGPRRTRAVTSSSWCPSDAAGVNASERVAIWGCRGFFQLLKEQGYQFGNPVAAANGWKCHCHDDSRNEVSRRGLGGGDRQATAGNMVMYDRTDKVLEIDRHSVMAIAGVPATAYEMVRVLEHSFKYYRRTQLQELSFEGSRAVSKLLKENVPAALAGTGRSFLSLPV